MGLRARKHDDVKKRGVGTVWERRQEDLFGNKLILSQPKGLVKETEFKEKLFLCGGFEFPSAGKTIVRRCGYVSLSHFHA